MNLTENECSEALTRLLRPYFAKVSVQDVYHSINKGHSIEEDSNLLTLLILEYFANQPLTSEYLMRFDEIEDGMLVWDDKLKKYWLVIGVHKTIHKVTHLRVWKGRPYYLEFEENRFFRKEAQE